MAIAASGMLHCGSSATADAALLDATAQDVERADAERAPCVLTGLADGGIELRYLDGATAGRIAYGPDSEVTIYTRQGVETCQTTAARIQGTPLPAECGECSNLV